MVYNHGFPFLLHDSIARPREFDEEEVLDLALRAFWENGYEGTSLADLLEATGLTKSSLYGAFVNKETLFRKVLERYHQRYLAFRQAALAEPTPRRIAERLLHGMVELHTGAGTPHGCLETNAALACSPGNEAIREELASNRNVICELLRDRFEGVLASGNGQLPKGMTADGAAHYIATIIQGMAVRAKSGATREDLQAVVEATLLSWPKR